MEVSHFELVWKPQSPAAPIGQAGVDRVFQGYFLKITNLENTTYSFGLEFVAASVTDPLRSLSGNTVLFVDTPGSNNTLGTLNGNLSATVFTPSTGTISIPPNGTALVALLPSAFNGLPVDSTPLTSPNFEVRGYVRIRLPPVFGVVQTPFGNRFVLQSQASAPVRIMLTPQHRATYYTETGTLSDQTQSSLPTATGGAVTLLPPDPPFVIVRPPLNLNINLLERVNALIAEDDRATVLAALLSSMNPETADLSALNAGLAESGIGMALERRKPKK